MVQTGEYFYSSDMFDHLQTQQWQCLAILVMFGHFGQYLPILPHLSHYGSVYLLLVFLGSFRIFVDRAMAMFKYFLAIFGHVCQFLPIIANSCQCLPIFANFCQYLPIFSHYLFDFAHFWSMYFLLAGL